MTAMRYSFAYASVVMQSASVRRRLRQWALAHRRGRRLWQRRWVGSGAGVGGTGVAVARTRCGGGDGRRAWASPQAARAWRQATGWPWEWGGVAAPQAAVQRAVSQECGQQGESGHGCWSPFVELYAQARRPLPQERKGRKQGV